MALRNLVRLQRHTEDITQMLENEEAARTTAESMRVVLESNLDHELRIISERT